MNPLKTDDIMSEITSGAYLSRDATGKYTKITDTTTQSSIRKSAGKIKKLLSEVDACLTQERSLEQISTDLAALQSLKEKLLKKTQGTLFASWKKKRIEKLFEETIGTLVQKEAAAFGTISQEPQKATRLRKANTFKLTMNIPNKDGETPLHIAAKAGNLQTVQTLLDIGANANIRNKKGQAPYDLTVDEKILDLLANYFKTDQVEVGKPAQLSALQTNAQGLSPLHYALYHATQRGHDVSAKMLDRLCRTESQSDTLFVPQYTTAFGGTDRPPLHYAIDMLAKEKDESVRKTLLETITKLVTKYPDLLSIQNKTNQALFEFFQAKRPKLPKESSEGLSALFDTCIKRGWLRRIKPPQ